MPATYEIEIDGKRLKAEVVEISLNSYKVRIGGSEFIVRVKSTGVETTYIPPQLTQTSAYPQPVQPAPRSSIPEAKEVAPVEKKAVGPKEGNPVKVEVPGRVLKVLIKEGQKVRADDTIITLESMKMELEIKAGVNGRVKRILVKPGDSVNTGDTVALIG